MRFLFALLLCSAYWEEKCRGQCVPAGEGQADDAAQKHRVPEESRTGGREETQSRERGFVHPRLPLVFLVLFLLFIYRILLFLFLLLLSLSSWLSSIHFLRHSLLSLPAPHHLLIFFIFHSFFLLFHILQYSNTDSNEAVTCAVVTVFLLFILFSFLFKRATGEHEEAQPEHTGFQW